jgi:Raf kinase inhibitor-like YbhB/YbcL family protein
LYVDTILVYNNVMLDTTRIKGGEKMGKKCIMVVAALLIPLVVLMGCGGGTTTTTTSAAVKVTTTTPAPTTAAPATTKTQTQAPKTTTTTTVKATPTPTPTSAPTTTVPPTPTPTTTPTETQEPTPTPTPTPEPAVFTVTSSAFGYGEAIPSRHSYRGGNISPALEWSGAPEGTVSFALIMEDPDATAGIWTHWVVYNIPSDVFELTEGAPITTTLANGAMQGRSDFGATGYGGPSPPSGTHRYYFRLYALDTTLNFAAPPSRAQVLAAMEGHILAEAEYMGTYQA